MVFVSYLNVCVAYRALASLALGFSLAFYSVHGICVLVLMLHGRFLGK